MNWRAARLRGGTWLTLLSLHFVAGCADDPDPGLSGSGSGGAAFGSGGNPSLSGGTPSLSGGATGSGGNSSGGQSGLTSSGGITASGSGGSQDAGSGGAVMGSGGAASGGLDGTGGVVLPPPPTEFNNPIIRYDAEDPTLGPGEQIFTADGAGFAWNNKVYLYSGHDEATEDATTYRMFDWRLWVSQDLVHWENKGAIMRYDVFSWAKGGTSTGNANAGEVVHRDDAEGDPKFYFYAPVEGGQTEYGISIGVAVADQPEGPFKDARGIPLIYLADTAHVATHSWRNLDPSTFVDDDGRVYMHWGNTDLYWVELEEDMIHIKGETYATNGSGQMQSRSLPADAIHHTPKPPNFTEAPYLSKRGDLYYLSYASGFPESISYATSSAPTGPWEDKGVILDTRPNTGTVHQSIFDFNGASFISYHDASLPTGGDYRRSMCLDRLYYNEDGTIKKVVPTAN